MEPQEYKYIKAYGIYLGWAPGFILKQQRQALVANAPINSIYRDVKGNWHTTDILSPPTLALLNVILNHEEEKNADSKTLERPKDQSEAEI